MLSRTAVVVPQQSAYVVERLGQYNGVLNAGFHILVPFMDVIRYRHSLKEDAMDIPEQICITRDNVQVGVDGVLYLKVLNPERASYGISDYRFAITQLAQTTLRSEVGKIELDRTFEERSHINIEVVTELDKASEPWGVKVLRYEIKNITPPKDVLAAMEKQMRAEREKRAAILTSEGLRDSAINTAEGDKQQVIKQSEANRQQQINEAEGQASAILAVATATAEGIRQLASAIQSPGGAQAVQLRVAEQYITQFGNIAKEGNTLVVPANLTDVASMLALAMNAIKQGMPRRRSNDQTLEKRPELDACADSGRYRTGVGGSRSALHLYCVGRSHHSACGMDGAVHRMDCRASWPGNRRPAECHVRQRRGIDHRRDGAARGTVRCGESVHHRIHHRQYPSRAGIGDRLRRCEVPRTAIQSDGSIAIHDVCWL